MKHDIMKTPGGAAPAFPLAGGHGDGAGLNESLLLATVVLGVSDLDQALAFYTRTLGLASTLRREEYAEVDAPGLVIGLYLKPDADAPGAVGENGGRPAIALRVDNLDAAASGLQERGVVLRFEEHPQVRLAYFRDPDGTPLCLVERKLDGSAGPAERA